MPALPRTVSSPGTAGQPTVAPYPGVLLHELVELARNWVKMKVSPEGSARRTGTTAVAGSATPGLSAATAGSFQAPARVSAMPLPEPRRGRPRVHVEKLGLASRADATRPFGSSQSSWRPSAVWSR